MKVKVVFAFAGNVLLKLLYPFTFLLDKLLDAAANRAAHLLEKKRMVWPECIGNPDTNVRLERDIRRHCEGYILYHKRGLRKELSHRLASDEGDIEGLKIKSLKIDPTFRGVDHALDQHEAQMKHINRKADRLELLMKEIVLELHGVQREFKRLRGEIRVFKERGERDPDRFERVEERLERLERRFEHMDAMSEADNDTGEHESFLPTTQ